MKLLLDTQVLLRVLADSPRLGGHARELLTTPGAQCFVSAISLWEIAIKSVLRRADFEADAADVLRAARASGFQTLGFLPEHAVRVAELQTHHADPFDRALVAQAMVEPLSLVTHDRVLDQYGDFVVRI